MKNHKKVVPTVNTTASSSYRMTREEIDQLRRESQEGFKLAEAIRENKMPAEQFLLKDFKER